MARFAALRTPPVNQRLWLTILAETGYLSGFCLLMSLLIRLRWRRLRRTDMVAATLAAVTAPLALPSPGQAIAPDVMDEDAAEPALER